jgi:uncharacterized protein YciI
MAHQSRSATAGCEISSGRPFAANYRVNDCLSRCAFRLRARPPLARNSAMYAIALIRYRLPFEQIAPVVDEHRAYLRSLQTAGLLLASGPLDPRSGGMLLLRVSDDNSAEALDAIRDGDPFTKKALAQYELLPWIPVIGKDKLDAL